MSRIFVMFVGIAATALETALLLLDQTSKQTVYGIAALVPAFVGLGALLYLIYARGEVG